MSLFLFLALGDLLCFCLGPGSAVGQQSQNTLSKTSASASGDSSKVDSGMTECLTSCPAFWHIHINKCHVFDRRA